MIPEQSYYEVTVYYVDEGYSTGVIEDGKHHTRVAVFETDSEPLYDYDKASGQVGVEDGKWGWIKLTGIDDNKIEITEANEGLGKLYYTLYSEIIKTSPNKEDLCVVYRPTVDLGLYNDVQKAVVTINSQTETYVYDKRAANGGIFQFGVNEYDIQNSSNNPSTIKEVENAYAEYYQGLSDGSPDPGESTVTKEPYEDIGIRKEDVNINLTGEGSVTTNGSAIAGNYNDYDVNIEMTYRVKLYNQAAVTARVNSIIDYYMDSFELIGVYSDKECTKSIGGTPTRINASQSGYTAVNIPVKEFELKGNSSYEIFIKLRMKDPKSTLGGDVLDAGYKTWNYAEINGYGTNIGVIDIDSAPGDLIPEGRFENGPYDDDEGKSPTLTYKNPENASRKISGVVFEDVDTGKLEIKSYTGETRQGDGTYSTGDEPVAGAVVTLIELTESGTILDSVNDPTPGVRAQTITKSDGTFEFDKIVASNYLVRFEYGKNYETVLLNNNGGLNKKSYNGESYENTTKDTSISGEYWYTSSKQGSSYALDNENRRITVTENFRTLTNEKAEILNSWKDSSPNLTLIDKLIDQASMFAETDRMLLDVEYHGHEGYDDKIIETKENGIYEKTYIMNNINFGVVERERAELQINKKVSKISIVDSSGKVITEGTEADMKEGKIKYIKMIPNANGAQGFVDMEIDKELLSGATLKVTYEITVTNTSEAGNTIKNIQVVDYVSNNLNYDESYGQNSAHRWTPVTVQALTSSGLLNSTSLNSQDPSNRIDLLTYQTILMSTFDELAPNTQKTKYLTLEKNLSSEEDSDFNYENQIEILQSDNEEGRGDYSSIYGNLDPLTYTSRKGNLNWDYIATENENGFTQKQTITLDGEIGKEGSNPSIRVAEKDSGNAEEVIITPPTGAKGLVLQTQHYILALTFLTTLAGAIILIKKYMSLSKQ